MSRINQRAVRAANQVLIRSAALTAAEQGAECDAKFDGGEWSSTISATFIEAIETRLLSHVARRFNMSLAQLQNEMQHAEWDEQEHIQLRYLRQAG
jgi:hypothetical protein